MSEINTINELVQAVADAKARDFDVEFTIQERSERQDNFLVVDVFSPEPVEPFTGISGQYWFWADGKVMQVL
jgi:hypothetical protein